ncbi:Uncharacterised protein [uncultured archaeon]|nr:Uncharacterised protein [uncultured archaeon]
MAPRSSSAAHLPILILALFVALFAGSVSASAVDNYVWASSTSGSVSKIDKTTNSVVATVGSGMDSYAIAVDTDSVWVPASAGNTVSRISKTTNSVVATIDVGNAFQIAADSDSVWGTN